MTMLASIDDFAALTGVEVSDANQARITHLLTLASSSVLASAHGQTIVEATTTETIRQYQGVFYLPQRPVTAVSSVVIDGVTIDPDAYGFTAGGNRRPAKLTRRHAYSGHVYEVPWDADPRPSIGPGIEAVVTYTHGWATAPGVVISAVVGLAAGSYAAMAGTDGRVVESRSETIGGRTLAETYAASVGTTGGFLGPEATANLDRFFGLDRFTSVPVSS